MGPYGCPALHRPPDAPLDGDQSRQIVGKEAKVPQAHIERMRGEAATLPDSIQKAIPLTSTKLIR